MRALALTPWTRVVLLPEVPTMIESDQEDIEIAIRRGILGPGSLQQDALARIDADATRVRKLAEGLGRPSALGLQVVGGSPLGLVAEMTKDRAWGSETIKAIAIKTE